MADILRDGRARGWFHIDNALLDRYGVRIGAYGVAVYAVLARHADVRGVCFPSYQGIADRLGISRRQVIRTVGALADHGLIRIRTERAPGKRPQNIYVLTDDWCTPVTGVGQSPTIGAHGAPTNGDTDAPVTVVHPIGDPSAPEMVTEMHANKTQGTRPRDKTNGGERNTPAPHATRIPDDFSVTAALYAYAASKGVSREEADAITERFILYWQATARSPLKADWGKAWQSWLLGDLRDGKVARHGTPSNPVRRPEGARTHVDSTPDPTDHGPFAFALREHGGPARGEMDTDDRGVG